MKKDVLTIVASIKVMPEKLQFVLDEIEKIIPITREEKGCITYDLHVNNKEEGHILFYENWASYEEWQDHINAPHLKNYSALTKEFVISRDIFELTQKF